PSALEDERLVGAGQGAEPQVHQHDHAERAESTGLQLGEVVPGDVLHDPPAALYEAAVAGDEGDAQDVVTHCAEALAQRPRGRHPAWRAVPSSSATASGEGGATRGTASGPPAISTASSPSNARTLSRRLMPGRPPMSPGAPPRGQPPRACPARLTPGRWPGV